jgi:hypothetical protein
MEPAHMRKLVLMAIFCSGVFYAPLPLIAQKGGSQTPLIPVTDMPSDSGGATAPADPPLEVDSEAVPELVPPQHVGGGAEAPTRAPTPAPEEPAPAPAPAPAATPAPAAEPAQAPDDPELPVPDEEPTDGPTTPGPDEDEQDEEEFEEEFEEDFGEGPEAGEPDAPGVAPRATAGPQLPRTGADLPALLLSGLALTASGMSLRALCRARS